MTGGVPVVTAPAEIDITTAGQLRAMLTEWATRGHTTVVVDLTGTQFCVSDMCVIRLLALVAVQQLDHLLADPVQVGTQLDQHLGGDALTLTDQAEQDVLGADVVVAQLRKCTERPAL
jgi:hypothetical protein